MYLGVQLDRRLSFGEHLQIATAKVIQCGAALTRLMPNIGGPREAKRRLMVSVVIWKLLYAALVLTSALNKHAIKKRLFLEISTTCCRSLFFSSSNCQNKSG